MPADDRDRQLERALALHLGNASPDAACPDPEILAAYHERTLSLEEMAQWKGHISSCSRCQEALALVEESEKALTEDWNEPEIPVFQEMPALAGPQAQAAPLRGAGNLKLDAATPVAAGAPVPMEKKRGPRLNWRWVVPAGALAAAVIIWVGVREIQTANKAAKQNMHIAQNSEAPPPAAPRPSPPLTARSGTPKSEDLMLRKDSSVPKTAAPQSPASRVAAAPTVVQPQKEGQVAGAASASVRELAPSPQAEGVSAETPPKPNATQPAAAKAESETKKRSQAAQSPSGPPAPVVAGTAGAQANKPGAADKTEPPHGVTESVEVTAAAPALNTSQADLQMKVRDSQDLMRFAAEDHRLIVAPGQRHVWRVGEGGSIQRSTDGGKTWKKQNSGVTVDLTSGSAASDKVAWIAGKSGTLLLTTDGGKHWKQITTPISGDLGGVHAVDATHASIWDMPNRERFETSDRGETWTPPNE